MTTTTAHDHRLLRRLIVAMLVVSSAVPLALNLADPDLWGHVRYGEDWIAEGELPRTATHTYTAEGYPWINHENLAELLLATGFPTLGASGMLVAKCLLGLMMLVLMWRAAQLHQVQPIACWALMLLVATNLQAFFPLRPQLLSFLLCAVMLYVLENGFAPWDEQRRVAWRWLAVLPALFFLWANSHGGFVAGLAILFAFLAGRVVQLIIQRTSVSWKTYCGLFVLALACGAATFVNPYGTGLHRWLASSLGAARPEITEWWPPSPGNPVFIPFVTLLGVALVTLLMTDRKRDPVRIAILALVGWQACEHLRHIAFFAILCGFWLPIHIQSIADRLRRYAAAGLPTASLARWQRAAGVVGVSVVIALQSIALTDRLSSLPVYRSNYPVDALGWMAEQEVHGKLVVSFNWAQYAIAALAPEVRVAFDGRFRTCYPQEMVDMSFDFLMGDLGPRMRSQSSGPIDGGRLLEHKQPDYVLLDRRYPHAVDVMDQVSTAPNADWILVYQDALAQVWGRREVVDSPTSERFVAPEQRLISEHASATFVPWPALPNTKSELDLGSSPPPEQVTMQ